MTTTPHIDDVYNSNMNDDRLNHNKSTKLIDKSEDLNAGLNVFSATCCGWYHEKNEDYLWHNLSNGFFGLADGVGGGQLGDVASETLLKFLCEQHNELPTSEQIIHDLKVSDTHIQNVLAKHNARGASTVVLAWLDENAKGFISSVGDARIYLLDIIQDIEVGYMVKLTQLTMDQTYENLGVPVPEDRHPDDPIRMVGVNAVGEPPVQEVHLRHNQALLLCSDGIHKFLTLEEMETICEQYINKNINHSSLNTLCNVLIERAIDNESHDDCSVMIVLNNQPSIDSAIQGSGEADLTCNNEEIINNIGTHKEVVDTKNIDIQDSQVDNDTNKKIKLGKDNSKVIIMCIIALFILVGLFSAYYLSSNSLGKIISK